MFRVEKSGHDEKFCEILFKATSWEKNENQKHSAES